MLTPQDKDKLYTIIVSVIGKDTSIRNYKAYFNAQTVDIAQRMIKENKDCNEAMKALVVNLMEGSKLSPSRWIKRAFTILKGYTKESEFNGLACKTFTKYHWKKAIVKSTI